MTEAKRYNQGKPDLSLIPYCFEVEVARAMMHGEIVYGRNNYTSGHALTGLIASIKRHTGKLLKGEDIDTDSGCSHWAHIAAGCLMAIHQRELGTLKDDRYRPPQFAPEEPTSDNAIWEIRARSKLNGQYTVIESCHDPVLAVRRMDHHQPEWPTFDLEIVKVTYEHQETA